MTGRTNIASGNSETGKLYCWDNRTDRYRWTLHEKPEVGDMSIRNMDGGYNSYTVNTAPIVSYDPVEDKIGVRQSGQVYYYYRYPEGDIDDRQN